MTSRCASINSRCAWTTSTSARPISGATLASSASAPSVEGRRRIRHSRAVAASWLRAGALLARGYRLLKQHDHLRVDTAHIAFGDLLDCLIQLLGDAQPGLYFIRHNHSPSL